MHLFVATLSLKTCQLKVTKLLPSNENYKQQNLRPMKTSDEQKFQPKILDKSIT